MRGRRLVLGLAGAIVLAPLGLVAQQQPIFGCRTAISCRPSPLSNSALNDKAASGPLLGAGVGFGPGFHFGLVLPIMNSPARETTPAVDARPFHLRDVSLLPPQPTPIPTPLPTPPPTSPAPQ